MACSRFAIRKIEADERRPSGRLAERLADRLAIPAQERDAFLDAARSIRAAERLPLDSVPVHEAGKESAPFVGRGAEFGLLIGLLARLTAGAGHVVLLEGEPGIGKSRLLHELDRYCAARGLPTLATNCYEIERAMAYQPVIDLVGQGLELAPAGRLQRSRRCRSPRSRRWSRRWPSALPCPACRPTSPRRARRACSTRIGAAVRGAGGGRQLRGDVDDMQWADDASLRSSCITSRARSGAAAAAGVRLSGRGEFETNQELAAVIATLRRDPHARHLPLPGWPLATSSRFSSAGPPRLPVAGLAARLLREIGGQSRSSSCRCCTPGARRGRAGGAGGAAGGAARFGARAAGPASRTRRALLDVAAVLGRRFDFETLLALSPRHPEAFPAGAGDAGEAAAAARGVRGGFYDFSHDKVREVVYRDIGVARRVLLHRRWRSCWSRRPRPRRTRAMRAWPSTTSAAKPGTRPLHYLVLAAERSLKLFAMRESLQWFDRAVALVQAHPDAATPAQQMALHERRGAARAQAGQTDGAVADFQRVIDAARALGEREQARDVLIQLGMAYRRADDYEQATPAWTRRCRPRAPASDERHVADTPLPPGHGGLEQRPQRSRHRLPPGGGGRSASACSCRPGGGAGLARPRRGLHFADGQPAAAMDCFSRSLDLARGIGDQSYEAENLLMLGWACTGSHGAWPIRCGPCPFLDPALEIAREADLQWHLGPTLIGRAFACVALGRLAQAGADLQEALPQLEALGLVRYQIMAHDALGSLLLAQAGGRPRPMRHFERALVLADGAGIRYWLARVQARLALAQLRARRWRRGGPGCAALGAAGGTATARSLAGAGDLPGSAGRKPALAEGDRPAALGGHRGRAARPWPHAGRCHAECRLATARRLQQGWADPGWLWDNSPHAANHHHPPRRLAPARARRRRHGSVVPHSAAQFARAIIMPNLKPPVTTAAQAAAYRERILAAVPQGVDFEPLMTLYLTDKLPPDEIKRAKDAGVVAVKLYPAGATTNSDAGVTDMRKTYQTLEAMQRTGMLLLVHGEVTDPEVDVFDREAVFIDTSCSAAAPRFPRAEDRGRAHHHARGGAVRARRGRFTAGTITAHHLLYNRNAIFTGGIRPHYYCLPVLKREVHRAGAGRGGHQRQPEVLPGHRQRAASGGAEGARPAAPAATRRCGDRALCRGLRQRRRARQAGRLRQLQRRRLLRPAAQQRHAHAEAKEAWTVPEKVPSARRS